MKTIKRRRKFNSKKTGTIFLFLCVFILGMSVGVKVKAINNSNEDNGVLNYQKVLIKDGDSLWILVKNHYQGKKDIRKIIYETKELNKLESACIFPGQIIKIPRI